MADNGAPTTTKITMTDIAHKSGVSPATVSLVLRDKPGISPATRQRVLDSAAALGYIFSPSVTGERPFISSIGIIFKVRPTDVPQTNQFYAPVLSGIEAYCRAQNINLFYAQLPVDERIAYVYTMLIAALAGIATIAGLVTTWYAMEIDPSGKTFWASSNDSG